jgi:hypothetical protein
MHTVENLTGKRLVVVLVVFGLLLGPSTALAQEGTSPSVSLSETSVEIDATTAGTSAVTAEYEFDVEEAGSGDSALSSISGTMWQFSEREVGDISATVNGEEVDASVSEESRHHSVEVPVEDVSSGDTVTVTLAYEVSEPNGELKTPIWVPEYPTPGQANVVEVAVSLPDGTTVSGEGFPTPGTVDGNTAEYDVIHVPGFIALEYGESGTGAITSDLLYSIVGVVVIIGFIVGGLAIDRKTA